LGHPANAYFFVRHVAHGWARIKTILDANDTQLPQELGNEASLIKPLIKPLLGFLRERENTTKLPDVGDVEGAAFGIVRLHSMYAFKLERFAKEGVIDAVLDNGQVVVSPASILNMTCEFIDGRSNLTI